MSRLPLKPSTVRNVIILSLLLGALGGIVGLLGWWGWKTMFGWRTLAGYINPTDDPANRKDAVQVYAVLVAGMVAAVTAAVGLANLRFTRKSLNQQRALEEHRAQSTALQAYYEQIGKLLTEHKLGNTDRDDIRLLARAQTLTVLEGLEPPGKSRLLRFLIGSALVQKRTQERPPIIDLQRINLKGAELDRADLSGADLGGADLSWANLGGADLSGADLSGADLRMADLRRAHLCGAYLRGAYLSGADMSEAYLREADLSWADLRGADLRRADLSGAVLKWAKVTEGMLDTARALDSATMPDGSTRPAAPPLEGGSGTEF